MQYAKYEEECGYTIYYFLEKNNNREFECTRNVLEPITTYQAYNFETCSLSVDVKFKKKDGRQAKEEDWKSVADF